MGRFFGSCGLVFRSYRVGATFTVALCSLPHQWDDRKGRPYATGIHLLFSCQCHPYFDTFPCNFPGFTI